VEANIIFKIDQVMAIAAGIKLHNKIWKFEDLKILKLRYLVNSE
jgi:hypothetical protein